MMTLTLVLVAILLTVLVGAAAVYYGGNAYLNAHNEAQASALMTQGSQIKAASTLYESANGSQPSSIQDLVTANFLASAPPNWAITSSGEPVVYTPVSGTSLCQKFNQKYDGYAADAPVPSCSSVSSSQPVCCD